MPSLLALLICLLAFSGCMPRPVYEKQTTLVSVNIVDQQGVSETINNSNRLKQYEEVDFLSPQPYKKAMRVYSRDSQGAIRAYITSYHPNSEVKQYLEVVDGRACGNYREWHANGQPKVDATVISGCGDLNTTAEQSWLFGGYCRAWDECGNLQAEIPYVKGEQEGVALYYHPNGVIWRKIPYSRNKIEGSCEIFLNTGQLFYKMQFCNGMQHGPSERYWGDGRVASDEIFSSGKLMKGRYYDFQGTLISSIDEGNGFKAIFGKYDIIELQEFRQGVQEGIVKVFNPQGCHLSKIYTLKNGLKNGEEIEYWEGTDQPKLSIAWLEGKIHGLVKTWYASGVQESKREMATNKKNGLLTAWYTDGSLMLIEEYDFDKLVKGEYYKLGDTFPVSSVTEGKGTATLFDAHGIFLRKVSYRFGKPELDDA